MSRGQSNAYPSWFRYALAAADNEDKLFAQAKNEEAIAAQQKKIDTFQRLLQERRLSDIAALPTVLVIEGKVPAKKLPNGMWLANTDNNLWVMNEDESLNAPADWTLLSIAAACRRVQKMKPEPKTPPRSSVAILWFGPDEIEKMASAIESRTNEGWAIHSISPHGSGSIVFFSRR